MSECGSAHYTKIGDAGVRGRVLWTSLALLKWVRPTLRDRRDDGQRGSPYDSKFNVAEIGAVNMDDIGAVRKRSHSETGPHDSSSCVARVKYLYI